MRVRRAPLKSALRSLLRLLVLTVLVIVGVRGLTMLQPDCCATAAAAELEAEDSDGCCAADDGAGAEDGGHCSCPLPCSSGCAGHGIRALANDQGPLVEAPFGVRVAQPMLKRVRPPGPLPADILHVPKSLDA